MFIFLVYLQVRMLRYIVRNKTKFRELFGLLYFSLKFIAFEIV